MTEIDGAMPPSIDGIVIAAAAVEELETALKQRLGAVLKEQAELAACYKVVQLAAEDFRRLSNECNAADGRLQCNSIATIDGSIALLSDLHRDHELARVKSVRAFNATVAKAKSVVDLAAKLKGAASLVKSVRRELADNAVLQAAIHLGERASERNADRAEADVMEENLHVRTAAAPEAVVDLQASTKLLLDSCAEASELAGRLSKLGRDVSLGGSAQDIVAPVRPTEEEVQRYITQLEKRMVLGLSSRRDFGLVLPLKEPMLHKLNQANQDNAYQVERVSTECGDNLEGRVALALAALTKEAHRLSYGELWHAVDPDDYAKTNLDTYTRVAASATETANLLKLREAIRATVYSIARLNEALAAYAATHALGETQCSTYGIGASQSVKETLAWMEDLAVRTEETRKKNISRTVKLELLKESVDTYVEEVKSGKTKLHRLVVSLEPGPKVKPCDELRAIFNSASWIYCSQNAWFDEAAYPMY